MRYIRSLLPALGIVVACSNSVAAYFKLEDAGATKHVTPYGHKKPTTTKHHKTKTRKAPDFLDRFASHSVSSADLIAKYSKKRKSKRPKMDAIDYAYNQAIRNRRAAAQKKTIRAQRFVLLDSKGKTCALLDAAYDIPSLEMNDGFGHNNLRVVGGLLPEITVGQPNSGSSWASISGHGISLWRNSTTPFIRLYGSTLELYYQDGKTSATITVSGKDRPGVTLWYPNGKSAVAVEIKEDGLPRVMVWNDDGKACTPYIAATGTESSSGAPAAILSPNPLGLSRMPSSRLGGSIYSGVGGGHWIGSVSNNGGIIVLEDDSTWEVSPIDRIDTSLWLAPSLRFRGSQYVTYIRV